MVNAVCSHGLFVAVADTDLTMLVCAPTRADEIPGSSRFPGKGGLDFQEEVVRVPEAIGHAPDHHDAVVHPFQDTGVQGETSTGEDATGVFAHVALVR